MSNNNSGSHKEGCLFSIRGKEQFRSSQGLTFKEGQATDSLLALNNANKRSFLSHKFLLDEILLKSLELCTDTLDEYISIF